jgi:glutaredoxin 3
MNIRIYTRVECSYCYAAKRLLTLRGLKYEEIPLATEGSAEKEMIALTGRRSVPQILIDEQPIGGYSELVDMDMEGQLGKPAK